MNGIFDMKKFSSLYFYHDKNCHSHHLFVSLTLREDINIDCGDTIDTNVVARVDGNTNNALFVVDGKLQDASYPCPRYDIRHCQRGTIDSAYHLFDSSISTVTLAPFL
jgi:hypothetical protein